MSPGADTADFQEVFRSLSRGACEERALVLTAVNIQGAIRFDGAEWLLGVDPADALRALAHLHQYKLENVPAPPAPPAPRVHAHSGVGALVYGLVLVSVALAISNGLWRPDAFEIGALDAARVQGGQWWRLWTALTLHVSAQHLFANLAGGVWFGILAARQVGSGTAWLLIVTGAALANGLEAQWAPEGYRSVGASTAVFTALGLMAAHSWQIRLPLRQSWAKRWAPLVAGTVLLGWLGTAGEGTDVVAHLLGFAVGCVFGAMAGLGAVERFLNRIPQWLSGLGALASVALAWSAALRS
ncbi:MAG TPA: rhomboid family intramembrane serine protease [Steroidobacteraceae bacterium]|nr:rhomboid family intramembrane serine protease [Steroidobacteraceae bacterium]